MGNSLAPMNDGLRAGLHFSCCGHVAERLVDLLSGSVIKSKDDHVDKSIYDDSLEVTKSNKNELTPVTKIDAYGLKNLSIDISEFETFAKDTESPQLSECFNELKCLTLSMLDIDLPT